MATYRTLIEGLELLATLEGRDTHGIDAEHDQIFAGPDIDDVPAEMQTKLEALGWFKSEADRYCIFT